MRLDEDQLDTLRRWGKGLRQAEEEEQAAAGRAILLLLEEIDRLQIELSHARSRPDAQDEDRAPREEPPEDTEPVESSLQARLRRAIGRESEAPPAEAEPTASPQSWIEALRRQR